MADPTLNTRVLIDRHAIAERVAALGAAISRDYAGQELTVVCVLKGAFMFAADLVRAITAPVRLEFIGLRSYEGMASTGSIVVTSDVTADLAGKHVLVVEDIVDTGHTVAFLTRHFAARAPRSVKVCAFLSKPEVHADAVAVDYVGFEIPKAFVIGYGLDLDGRYREVPDLLQVIAP